MITNKPTDLDVGLADAPGDVEIDRAVPGQPARRPWWTIPVGLLVLVGVAWLVARIAGGNADAPRYLTAPVSYADISATVEETGTVNPVNEVQVGTQVSGTISGLSVDFNSIVRKGQVLATLDPTPLQAAAIAAHGTAAAAQSNAAAAESTASQSAAAVQNADAAARAAAAGENSAAANVSKVQAQLDLSRTTVARDRSLLSQGFIAQSQVDTDVAAERANEADLQAAQAALVSARAQAAAASTQIASATYQHSATMHQADAAAAQAQAGQGQVQQADYNLARAVITSPIDGVVVSRNVSVGQTVAASFQTPTLFVIASSLRDMQIDTSVSEADVGQLRTGAIARISVPAFPNTVFRGTVAQVRVNPTTVQNVVTYDAIVSVHDSSARLKPGMTADVTIAVDTHRHALAIPAAALLYRPSADTGHGGSTSSASPGTSSSGASAPVAGAPGSKAVIYILRGGRAVSVPVVIGISDGRNYEVQSGKLQAGDRVVVGQLQTNQYNNANPMAGGTGFGR
jgi:HlyD family secretion protein